MRSIASGRRSSRTTGERPSFPGERGASAPRVRRARRGAPPQGANAPRSPRPTAPPSPPGRLRQVVPVEDQADPGRDGGEQGRERDVSQDHFFLGVGRSLAENFSPPLGVISARRSRSFTERPTMRTLPSAQTT